MDGGGLWLKISDTSWTTLVRARAYVLDISEGGVSPEPRALYAFKTGSSETLLLYLSASEDATWLEATIASHPATKEFFFKIGGQRSVEGENRIASQVYKHHTEGDPGNWASLFVKNLQDVDEFAKLTNVFGGAERQRWWQPSSSTI